MAEQKQQEKDIAAVFQGKATKANGSALEFEVGRERGTVSLFLRVVSNDGGGTFSKAWQPIAILRDALAPFAGEGKTLRFAEALGPVIPQKGRNNAPFVGYVLAAIGILASVAEKPGVYTVAGGWEAWCGKMLSLPLPAPPPPPAPAEIPAEQQHATAQETSAPARGKRAAKRNLAKLTDDSDVATVISVEGNPPA